jgi:hypothetical protein
MFALCRNCPAILLDNITDRESKKSGRRAIDEKINAAKEK